MNVDDNDAPILYISDHHHVVRLKSYSDRRTNKTFINIGTELCTKEDFSKQTHRTLDGYKQSLQEKLCSELNRNDVPPIIFVVNVEKVGRDARQDTAHIRYNGIEATRMQQYVQVTDDCALKALKQSKQSGTVQRQSREQVAESEPVPLHQMGRNDGLLDPQMAELVAELARDENGPAGAAPPGSGPVAAAVVAAQRDDEPAGGEPAVGAVPANEQVAAPQAAAFQPVLTGLLAPDNISYVTIHSTLQREIKQLQTLEECSDFYRNPLYVECIKLLRSAHRQHKDFLEDQGFIQDDIETRESFAKHWAIELKEDKDWAWALNYCRITSLMLLYKVCDLSYRKDGSSPTGKFKGEKIYQILIHCLVMDRANALYNMNGGQGWYSKKDKPEYLYERLLPENKNPKGKASINMRLHECYDDTMLELKEDPAIRKWMEWKAPLGLEQEEQEVRQKLVELRERLQNEEQVQQFLFLEQFKDLEVAEDDAHVAAGLEVAEEDGVSRPKRSRTQRV